jgi:diguanylate cyclase
MLSLRSARTGFAGNREQMRVITFLLVVAIFNIALGYVLGCLGAVGGLSLFRKAETESSAAAGPDPTAQSSEFLARLQELATNVQDLAGKHSTRVGEITEDLTAATAGNSDPAAVLAAATALIKANRQLEEELATTKHEIELQQQQLESTMAVARTDPLTSIPNRRAYDDALVEHFERFKQKGTSLCLLMLDVDHFKKFNDHHGHQAGDEVLRGVAQVLKDTMRETDVVARYGGEEFCVLLPATTVDEAKVAAERVRHAVGQARFDFEGAELQVTVSVGLASVLDCDSHDTLVRRADEALYEAKKNGRNRSYFHNGTSTEPIEVTLRDSRRFAFNSIQRVAPYNGVLPTSSRFIEVECEDLSSTGFAFLIAYRPSYEQVAVAFGSPEDPFYRIASIRNCTEIGTPSNPMYRVGCVFTDRITPGELDQASVAADAASAAGPAAEAPIASGSAS